MPDLVAENACLRAELNNFDHCLGAFVEASIGVIAELDAFVDACSTDPGLHERARAHATAAGERMHAVVDAIGHRFPTYAVQD